MFIQVFNNEDKEKLILTGNKFITEQQIGDVKVFLFEVNKNLNFDSLGIKYNITNKLFFS